MREAPDDQPPEFDAYAREYAELIRDPIRERFAGESRFFFERKLQVIEAFYGALGISTRTQHWLDVGCGRGDLLHVGAASFASATGCDPSREMLQACKGLDVRHQPAVDRLPFEARSFDFVTAVCVYHHVPSEERPSLTGELMRVLKPGGILSIIEHNPLNPATRLIVSRTPVDRNAKLLTAGETRRLAASAGGQVLQTRYFLYFPEQIYKRLGILEHALGRLPLGGQYSVFCKRR